MRDLIKTKENNQRRRYKYVKSREISTTVVNMGTRVDILWRDKKKSTVRTAKNMDTSLKNDTARISMVKNVHTVTKTVTKKGSSGRNKKTTKINKGKSLMSLKIYIMPR